MTQFSLASFTKKMMLVTAASLMASTTVNAAYVCGPESNDDFIDSCWYLGIGLGQSIMDPQDDDDWQTIEEDDGDTAGYLAVGNRFKPKWFTELRITDLGSVDVETIDAANTDTDMVNVDVTDFSVGYYLLGLPEKRFNIYGRLGAGLLNTEAEDSLINLDNATFAELIAGIGLQVRLGERYFVRAEASTYGEDYQAGFVSINRYFGKSPEPAVVYQEPKPEPIAMVQPPMDSDGDGVNDDRDNCPDTPAGALVDANGCAKQITETIRETMYIEFETNKAEVSASSYGDIQRLTTVMTQYPNTKITITGHTDSIGSEDYNQKLSESRAIAVKRVMVETFKIADSRITAIGKGESAPIASNDTAAGRSQNRRVESSIEASFTRTVQAN